MYTRLMVSTPCACMYDVYIVSFHEAFVSTRGTGDTQQMVLTLVECARVRR